MTDGDAESTALDIVARNGAWSAEVKARAKMIWSTIANRSPTVTEMYLQKEAEAEATLQGPDVLPEPVPASNTIYVWSRKEDWAGDASTYMLATYQKDRDELEEMMWGNQRLAVENITLGLTGGMDHLQGPAVNARLKSSELAIKVYGWGTFGANQGGMMQLDPTKGLEAGEESKPTLQERARRMREKIEEENRGG